MAFIGNFVDACGAWVTMVGATSAELNNNYHFAVAVEGAAIPGSIAINCNGATNGSNVYDVPGFFNNFGASTYILNVGNGNTFRITGFNPSNYAALSINGVGNIIQTSGASGFRVTNAIPTMTATNTRSSFHGGVPLGQQVLSLSFAVPTLTSGQYADFYAYSPLTDGYGDKFFLQAHFDKPLVVSCVEDVSVILGVDGNASPNQIHIRLLAVGNVGAGNQYGTLFAFGG